MPRVLSDLAFHILLALGEGPSHGYAIGKNVEERSAGRLDPTTGALYQALPEAARRLDGLDFSAATAACPNGLDLDQHLKRAAAVLA